MSAVPTRFAFIGLGRMGNPMAWNLFKKNVNAEGAQFFVCDAHPQTATTFATSFRQSFPNASITPLSKPADAVAEAQVIVTMLPSSPQVKAVYSEEGGIIDAIRAHANKSPQEPLLCIDSTTLDVKTAINIATETKEAGAEMIDAPVSGGVTGAKAGSLSFLVGGPERTFARATPVLSLMGGRVLHCGRSGAGLSAKICNNLVLGVHQVVVAEAMMLGSELGLDPAVLANVLNSSTGACWASSVNNPIPGALPDKEPPSQRGYEGGFSTDLMLKDMRLASDAATLADTPLPLGKVAEAIYESSLPVSSGKDFSSVYLYLTQLRDENSARK